MALLVANLPLFLDGVLATLRLALATLVVSTALALVVGLMSIARWRMLRWPALGFVELFRAIPLIVNLLFVYFGAPLLGLGLDPFGAAVVSFSSWGGANGAEIVRGGFNAVPAHQRESAAALGLKPWQILVLVLAPQVLPPIIPPFTGLFSVLVQATSLASLVGALEFFRAAQIVVERTTLQTGYSPAFVVYAFVLAVYFVICFGLAALTRRLERRLATRAGPGANTAPRLRPPAAESL
jgi:polar amino acid transport system permease protein